MSNFRTIDRETGFLLPPSVDEWLPKKHLARFVVEVVEGLDLRAMSGGYRGSGSASYHPRMLLGLIPERSATRLREADLNVLSKLGKQGLEWRLKPEAFTRREVGRQDDLLDVLVGCPVDIEMARQPSP